MFNLINHLFKSHVKIYKNMYKYSYLKITLCWSIFGILQVMDISYSLYVNYITVLFFYLILYYDFLLSYMIDKSHKTSMLFIKFDFFLNKD
jgi:hypothetical protein